MKKTSKLLITTGFLIIGCALYFFLFGGIVDLIDQIKNNFNDSGKTAWAIIRIFPLTEIAVLVGFLISSIGGGNFLFNFLFDD